MSGIAGKAAIVTGAGRGIGRAIAVLLAREGARVSLLARTEAQLREARDEVVSAGEQGAAAAAQAAVAGKQGAAAGKQGAASGKQGAAEGKQGAASGKSVPAGTRGDVGAGSAVTAICCDVTDPASVRAAVAEAEIALGPTEILVNGAGDARSAPLLKTDDALWAHLLAVNLTGTFLMIREVAAGMIQRGAGRIVNVASVAGLTGASYVSAYAAAKHGVVGLTRALSQELAKSGITVNAVCPGYVDTSLTDRSVANIVERTGMPEAQARSVLARRSPQNRMMTPEEVAALAVYLASDEARGINGQAIVLDGGGLVA